MADEIEEVTEPAAELAQVEDKAPVEKTAVKDAAAPKDEAAPKQTKTLLSDDEGDGSDQVDPSTYEFTPPEDFVLSEDVQSRIDGFKETAADWGLSPEQFQKAVEFDFNRSKDAMSEMAGAYTQRIEAWADEVRADKELGGDNLKANLGAIKKVTDAYSDDAFKALIGAPSQDNPDGLGLGNNPAFLRFLHKVSKSLTDAEIIEGTASGPSTDDRAGLARMYPTMFKQAS